MFQSSDFSGCECGCAGNCSESSWSGVEDSHSEKGKKLAAATAIALGIGTLLWVAVYIDVSDVPLLHAMQRRLR